MGPFDVRVCGAGIVGKTLALALSRLGLSVALRSEPARSPQRADVRAYALNAGSIALLRRLKVWESLPADATTPVRDMLVHGDAAGAALEFSAWEQRVGELAVIADAAELERQLEQALRFAPHVSLVESDVAATLVAHCEGRAAAALQSLGAGFEQVPYGQRAIAARLVASRPHAHVARQWFRAPRRAGAAAIRPARGELFLRASSGRSTRSALPICSPPRPPSSRAELMRATNGEAGELKLATERAAWPLLFGRAQTWCGPGWVLAGDAAHVVHPLAGQGLNLGLADVAALIEVIEAREPWRSVGDERLLRRYVRQRAAPTWAMLRITDGLLRLFSATPAPIRELRNNGMTLVNHVSPLKRWLTARALDS